MCLEADILGIQATVQVLNKSVKNYFQSNYVEYGVEYDFIHFHLFHAKLIAILCFIASSSLGVTLLHIHIKTCESKGIKLHS